MQNDLKDILPRLWGFAYSLTQSAVDADDLMQETVERVLKASPAKDVVLLYWSFRVCRNLWIDKQRKARKHVHVPLLDEEGDMHYPDNETAISQKDELNKALAAIQELAAELRETFVLVALEGLSYRETSSILDIPIGTVMSRVARARRSLRSLLRVEA